MANDTGVKSVMVEFNRPGGSGGSFQIGTRYIRTAGFEIDTNEPTVGISYEDFILSSHALRYSGGTPEEVQHAIQTFQDEAARMFDGIPLEENGLTQIDLVTGAAELWAFPFEAFAFTKPGVVLTRRIRGNFIEDAPWPAVPKILFAHAAVGSDLKQQLVDDHVAALKKALHPWTGGDPDAKTLEKFLVVKEVRTLEQLQAARQEQPFTHIHILGHGILVPFKGPLKAWGMRFGVVGSKGVPPADIAKTLAPIKALPVVVTIAACDSGNQADSALASYSLAQELHRLRVPVVVASQLPLTMPGSVVLTDHFYEPLLLGEDVRKALFAALQALHEAKANAHHDWLSVVAYVRLPETYARVLGRVSLEMALAMFRAARDHADRAIQQRNPNALMVVEELVRARIQDLEELLPNLKEDKDRLECQGLLGSGYKRLAEVLFLRGHSTADQRQELEKALQYYGAAFTASPNMHWQGVQQLALQAALHGEVDPLDYAIVRRVAQRAAEADPKDYWARGTLAELQLLAAFAKQPQDLVAAEKAIGEFKLHVKKREDIDSARFQFERYVGWWIPANEFKTDLGVHAKELAALLA